MCSCRDGSLRYAVLLLYSGGVCLAKVCRAYSMRALPCCIVTYQKNAGVPEHEQVVAVHSITANHCCASCAGISAVD